MADGADGLGEVLGAAVVDVVAVDRGDDDVVEAELGDGVGDAPGLEGVEGVGAAGRDVAEGAAAGADLAHDHHGGVALAPALADVGAARLLADRHQAVLADGVAGALVAGGDRGLDADPVGLALARGLGAVGLLGVAFAGDLRGAWRLLWVLSRPQGARASTGRVVARERFDSPGGAIRTLPKS